MGCIRPMIFIMYAISSVGINQWGTGFKPVTLPQTCRDHLYIVGGPRTGKTTVLSNLAKQDLRGVHALAFLDPNGSTAQDLAAYVPRSRTHKTIYFRPGDYKYSVGINLLEFNPADYDPDARGGIIAMAAEGVISIFRHYWHGSWSASRMEDVIRSCFLAGLEHKGFTLLDILRMLIDDQFREGVLSSCTNPVILSYWNNEYPELDKRLLQETRQPVQTRVRALSSNPFIRNIFGQSKSTIDFKKLISDGGILLVDLSQGAIGDQPANLIGSILISKLHLAALSFHDRPKEERPSLNLYVNKFHQFSPQSIRHTFSVASTFNMSIALDQQFTRQTDDDQTQAAIMNSCRTKMVFRVDTDDAEIMQRELGTDKIKPEDLAALRNYEAYMKYTADDDEPLTAYLKTNAPIFDPALTAGYRQRQEKIIRASRDRFARERATVDAHVRNKILP